MESEFVNTSGQGSSAVVPPEIKGWNWGAFLMHWIWAIGNKVWIGLLTLVLGLIMQIILGVKGSEWAWQNRRWESIEQFKAVQRIWMWWGLGLLIASFVIVLAGLIFPVVMHLRTPMRY